MKKKFLLFSIIAVLIITLIGIGVNMFFFKKDSMFKASATPEKFKKTIAVENVKEDDTIGTFNLDEFGDEIDWYVGNEYFSKEDVPESLGFIDSPQTAKEKAKTVFLKIYGEKTVINRKPFSVSFDEENQVWLVQGTLPDNMEGGAPHILIRKSDGKVIAVWNYK